MESKPYDGVKKKQDNKRNYTHGKVCNVCGKPVVNSNNTGLCKVCRYPETAKTETIPHPAETIAPADETKPADAKIDYRGIDIVMPVVKTPPSETMPPTSLGAAKLAIDRAFQDAERFQEAKNILSEIKSLIIRFEQVIA